MPPSERGAASAEAQACADLMFDDVLPSTPEQMALALDTFAAARVRAAVERCIQACNCLPEGLALVSHQNDAAGKRARAWQEALEAAKESIRSAFAAPRGDGEQHKE